MPLPNFDRGLERFGQLLITYDRMQLKKRLTALPVEAAHFPEALAVTEHRPDYLAVLNAGIVAGYKAAMQAMEEEG